MDILCLKVENSVAKGAFAGFGPFLLLSLCFQKAVCYRGIIKRLLYMNEKVNSFGGNVEVFVNNTVSGETAHYEISIVYPTIATKLFQTRITS